MGTITCQTIIDDARALLFDSRGSRWPDSELFDHLIKTQQEIVDLKPTANPVVYALQLVAGTVQALGDSDKILLDAVRNLGPSTAAVDGPDIRKITRENLTAFRPNWRNDTADATVKHVMYDPQADKSRFEVYPPQPDTGMGRLEVIVSRYPDDPEDADAVITLADEYAQAIQYGILRRAFQKDNEIADVSKKVSEYDSLFRAELGIKAAAEQTSGQG